MTEDKSKLSRASQLRDAIEQDIVTGRFTPGEKLDETQLAARFGVSRTPIREALMQLEGMGLIAIARHKGAFVTQPSLADMLGMFEVMAELEGMCARLSARRITNERLEMLEEAQRACLAAMQADDADGYYYANEQFHTILYQSSGNNYLAQTAATLHNRLKPYRRLQLRVAGRMKMSAHEHDDIIAALRDRNPEAAERLTKTHIIVQGDKFSDFLSALETWDPSQRK